MINESYRPNRIEIKRCLLFNYRNNSIDIHGMMRGFSIYHDIMANGMECEILLVDAGGLIEMLPVVGDENLFISFKTPTFDSVREYIFRIYSITNREKNKERSDVYILRGCSQEIINNNIKSVDKSYSGLKVSDIVKSIYHEYLQPDEKDFLISKKKSLFIQDTEDNHHLIFTGEKPFDAINKASFETKIKTNGKNVKYNFNRKKESEEELIDTSESSNLVFYEDYNGWNFRTIDSLISQKPSNNFYLMDANLETPIHKDKVSKFQIINSMSFDKQFDTLKGLRQGLYYHSVETIDPITKRFKTDNYSYNKDSNKISHLEKERGLYSAKSLFKKDNISSLRYYIQSNIGEDYNKQPYLSKAITNDPQIRNPRTIHKYFKYDLLSRLQLNNIVISIGVPGNTDLDVGQVVNIFMPQLSDRDDYKDKTNLLFTGKIDENGNRTAKFFITSIKHDYNMESKSFITTFRCVKDTYGKKVIEETRDVIDEDE
jgi:hypothetical protein